MPEIGLLEKTRNNSLLVFCSSEVIEKKVDKIERGQARNRPKLGERKVSEK